MFNRAISPQPVGISVGDAICLDTLGPHAKRYGSIVVVIMASMCVMYVCARSVYAAIFNNTTERYDAIRMDLPHQSEPHMLLVNKRWWKIL
jgi:hypothetical protein